MIMSRKIDGISLPESDYSKVMMRFSGGQPAQKKLHNREAHYEEFRHVWQEHLNG
jgi:hypothetical protein